MTGTEKMEETCFVVDQYGYNSLRIVFRVLLPLCVW